MFHCGIIELDRRDAVHVIGLRFSVICVFSTPFHWHRSDRFSICMVSQFGKSNRSTIAIEPAMSRNRTKRVSIAFVWYDQKFTSFMKQRTRTSSAMQQEKSENSWKKMPTDFPSIENRVHDLRMARTGTLFFVPILQTSSEKRQTYQHSFLHCRRLMPLRTEFPIEVCTHFIRRLFISECIWPADSKRGKTGRNNQNARVFIVIAALFSLVQFNKNTIKKTNTLLSEK